MARGHSGDENCFGAGGAECEEDWARKGMESTMAVQVTS